MKTHVAILRGINVGGRRKILMKDLKALMGGLGYDDVETYIQSGNVVFTASNPQSSKDIAQDVSQAIAEQYGFDVPVLVRTAEEWDKTVLKNPYLKDCAEETLHVTFLAEEPSETAVEKAKSYDSSPDEFSLIERDVYLMCGGKYHETKLSNHFFESKLKVSATTRNWRTVTKIHDLLAG